MDKSIAFASVCPRCGQSRSQRGYTREALLIIFNSDRPIKATCVACDQSWPISAEERIYIAEVLAGCDTPVSPPSDVDLPPPRPGA